MVDTLTSKGLIIQDPNLAYDIGKHNSNYNLINDMLGVVICTSGTRPSAPWNGMRIYETDTRLAYVRVSGAWVRESTAAIVTTAAGLPTASSQASGQLALESDTGRLKVNNAGTWEDKAFMSKVCTSGTRPASPTQGMRIFETDTSGELIWTGSTWLALTGGYYFNERRKDTSGSQNFVTGSWTTVTFPTNFLAGRGISYSAGVFTVTNAGKYIFSAGCMISQPGAGYVFSTIGPSGSSGPQATHAASPYAASVLQNTQEGYIEVPIGTPTMVGAGTTVAYKLFPGTTRTDTADNWRLAAHFGVFYIGP